MSIAVHHTSELGGLALVALVVIAFVVIALTWVPEMIAPSGDKEVGASDVGRTVRMIN
jgi:hypothetical protein